MNAADEVVCRCGDDAEGPHPLARRRVLPVLLKACQDRPNGERSVMAGRE
jgi:hypothetical protein